MARTYQDPSHFFSTYEMPIPKSGDWRLVDPHMGEVNGLPQSRGHVVVTNGIMCYIELSDGTLYEGHFTAWVPDKMPPKASSSAKRKTTKISCFEGL